MYLNQKIVTHFVKAKKPKTLQMYIQVGKCKKLHKATRNTLVGRGKKKEVTEVKTFRNRSVMGTISSSEVVCI